MPETLVLGTGKHLVDNKTGTRFTYVWGKQLELPRCLHAEQMSQCLAPSPRFCRVRPLEMVDHNPMRWRE